MYRQPTAQDIESLWGVMRAASQANDVDWSREAVKWLLTTERSTSAIVYHFNRWPDDQRFINIAATGINEETDSECIDCEPGRWKLNDACNIAYAMPELGYRDYEVELPLWPIDIVVDPPFTRLPIRAKELSHLQGKGIVYYGWLNEIRIWTRPAWSDGPGGSQTMSRSIVPAKGHLILWRCHRAGHGAQEIQQHIEERCIQIDALRAKDEPVWPQLAPEIDGTFKLIPMTRKEHLADAWRYGDLLKVDVYFTSRLLESGQYDIYMHDPLPLKDAKHMLLDGCAARWSPVAPPVGLPDANVPEYRLEVLNKAGDWCNVIVTTAEHMLSCFEI